MGKKIKLKQYENLERNCIYYIRLTQTVIR